MFKTLDNFVGNTPLVKLQRMAGNTSNTILLKLEGNNPAGSVKDRPAYSMISRAEARGDIKPGDTLIEATSGNTGIALAFVAAARGIPLTLTMPETMSMERRKLLTALGARLVLTEVVLFSERKSAMAGVIEPSGPNGLIGTQAELPLMQV